MEITGRVTQDATVRTTKSNKEVVNFAIAINYQYKKDGVKKRETTYVNCVYWHSAKVAPYLTKGCIVTLSGRMSATAYIDMLGEVQPVLSFFVRDIAFVSGSRKQEQVEMEAARPATGTKDDLPF